MSYSLVWFKRDLRWQDHEALAYAAKQGPVRCIYVVEPELWWTSMHLVKHFASVQLLRNKMQTHHTSLDLIFSISL